MDGLTSDATNLLERGAAHPPSSHILRHRRRRCLWPVAFYGPAVALPLASRVLVLSRDGADLGLASALKGAAFGGLQDAAVLLQTLVAARVVLHVTHRALQLTAHAPLAQYAARAVAALALSALYLWLTLACAVDLALLLRFLPRLNRGFVLMYLQFSSQFASSLEEVCSPQLVLAAVVYIASMMLWVVAVLGDKVQLPQFGLLVCESPTRQRPTEQSAAKNPLLATRSGTVSVRVKDVGVFPWALHIAMTSIMFRTCFLALLVSASALHVTLALDGNGNDIYLLSNAMFSLETESFLRASTSTHAAATATLHHQFHAVRSVANTNTSTLVDGFATANVTRRKQPPLSPFYDRTIGRNEWFEPASDDAALNEKFPFWRKTVRFTGEKRFEWPGVNKAKPPPTVILLNLESFRSREVGVLGGRENVERYNQTVTPFFDSLSKSGVLFKQHYTPCVQTSRTLLSSLFGVLPSMKDASAIATFPQTKLRLHGLPQILKQALNYTTTFWSAVNLSWEDWRGFLLANGFDTLVDDASVLNFLSKSRRAALTNDDAFSWGRHDHVSFEALINFLRAHQKRVRDGSTPPQPLFVDAYSVSSHDPWKVPENFKPSTNYSQYLTSENEKYVHSLNFVDQCLEKLFRTLRRKKLLDNTIVLIEGDHGFGRMEHGNNPTIVASYVYDVGTHVPMLLVADDFLAEKDKGTVVDELTSQTDLLSTITDMLGIENFMQHGVGQSMLRKRDAGHTREREVVLTNPFYGQTRGLRVGRDLKYARYGSGKYEVFNLTQDPLEQTMVETGKLSKNADGRFHFGGSELNETTAEALKFLEEVVDVASLLYETNGFMPSHETETPAPQSSDADNTTVVEASPVGKQHVMDVVRKAMHAAKPSNGTTKHT